MLPITQIGGEMRTVTVRGGIGWFGALAVLTIGGCVTLAAILIGQIAAYGATFPAFLSLFIVVLAPAARPLPFLWRIGRRGIGRRLRLTPETVELRTVGGETRTVPWSSVSRIDYGYDDGGGLPVWHLWTFHLRGEPAVQVTYPIGVPQRPTHVRRAIATFAPAVTVHGSWREPEPQPGHAIAPESAGTTPAPPTSALVVRSRFGALFLLGVVGSVASLLLFITGLSLALNPPADTWDLWAAVVVIAFAGVFACAALSLRIVRAGRRPHMWLTAHEIGFRTADTEREGRAPLETLSRVQYENDDARGFVYTHRWILTFTDRPPVTIVYPAGASPQPWRIRRALRRLATGVEVSGGWW
ncbi:hypothetical protein [Tsukamurella strandjordii]|uniref:PH domain-containing protein n=1 Tax=Tsukamurella strandjordii TaxID=147577 RepID=A0AA90N867_9ACTN|nr:hypothetical protein [Tsukamurella strandjordii]MDP0397366.1 hypothetical protein [Tsukamurella strandjordii]